MSNYTPGPWYIGAQNDYLYVIDRMPRPSNDYPNHEADTEVVAKPFAARGYSVEANARLMAAAPELLAALKAEEEWQERDAVGELDPEWDYESMVAAKRRAAIAKATGSEA